MPTSKSVAISVASWDTDRSLRSTKSMVLSATRRGRLTTDEGARALEHMLGLGVVLADPEPRAVLTTAADLGVSVCDAAYAALAEALSAPLWSGDRRLFDTVRTVTGTVHWIGDYAGHTSGAQER